jgi:hypothetical protein
MARRRSVLENRCAFGGRARCCRPVPRPRLLAARQIAVNGDRANRTPANRELDLCYRRRCGWLARLACAPAAGGAGCAGRRAGLTHPRRRTSTAPAVMSGGTAGPAACATARSSRRANSPGGSRASWPASATSTTLPSTPRLQPEEAPPDCSLPTLRGVDDPSRFSRGCREKWGNLVIFARCVHYSRGAALAGCDSAVGPTVGGPARGWGVRRGVSWP